MKKLILILVFIFNASFLIQNCLSQWIVQSSGVSVNLYDVKFSNRYTGWAVGENGTIIKTTNGGEDWNLIPNPSYNMGKILNCISVIDSNFAYVVGAHSTYLKTTNGGSNWIIIRNGPWGSGMGFRSVYFLNKDSGWAIGDMRLLFTKDGGVTFDSVSLTVMINQFSHDLHFKNIYIGITTGDGICYKTTNSGYNWFNTYVPTGGWAHMFQKISVVGDYVWLVGNGNIFYKSTNYAETWDSIAYLPAYPPSVMYCSYFSSITTGWAGGTYGYLYKTTNGGYNWIRENTGTDQRFWGAMWFYNDSIGWGVGGAGKIMHTTTGGQSLVNISSNENEIPLSFYLHQNYPNPFNNQTTIEFEINEDIDISIEIFDINGRKIDELVKGFYSIGKYSIKYNAENLNSGIYFYKMRAGEYTNTKKFILIK